MKKNINIILVLIFTAIGISAQVKVTIADTNKDETMIRANIGQTVKGWNEKNSVDYVKSLIQP